jgi:hypothetical protein
MSEKDIYLGHVKHINRLKEGNSKAEHWMAVAEGASTLVYLLMSSSRMFNELDDKKSSILRNNFEKLYLRVELIKNLPAGQSAYIHTQEEMIQWEPDGARFPAGGKSFVSGNPHIIPKTTSPSQNHTVEKVYGMKESYDTVKVILSQVTADQQFIETIAGAAAINDSLSDLTQYIEPPNKINTDPSSNKAISEISKRLDAILKKADEFPKASDRDSSAKPTVIEPPGKPFKIIDDLNNKLAKGEVEKEILNDKKTATELESGNKQAVVAGDVSNTALNKVMSIASLQKAPPGSDRRLWQAYCQYRISKITLAKNLYTAAQRVIRRKQAGGGSRPPMPIPNAQVPPVVHGPQEINYSIDVALIKKAADQKNLTGNRGMGAMFELLMKASTELKDFFTMAVSAGVTDERVWQLSCTFGYYLKTNEGLEAGDIARISNAMIDNGYCWGIIIKASGWNVSESLCLINGVFKHLKSPPGVVDFAWRPAPCLLFADNSLLGQFWGPRMSRMRKVVSQNLGIFGAVIGEEGFLRLIFENSRLAPRSCREFYTLVEHEIIPFQKNIMPVPGCILFSPDYSTIAVMLSNGNYVIAHFNQQAKYIPFLEFKPVAFWVPRM